MSMERMGELRPEDQNAARDLLMADAFLRNDPYAQRVVETGKADNELSIDVGDFLAARSAYIQQELAKEKLSKINPEMVTVVSSVRPDLEKYAEG